jgi:hypothetical protein
MVQISAEKGECGVLGTLVIPLEDTCRIVYGSGNPKEDTNFTFCDFPLGFWSC